MFCIDKRSTARLPGQGRNADAAVGPKGVKRLSAAICQTALVLVLLLTFEGVGNASEGDGRHFGPDPVRIDSKRLVHWIVATNADVLDQGYTLEAATHMVEAEKGLYEPIWTGGASGGSDRRRRSSAEYTSILASAKTEAFETTRDFETGVKLPLPTGGVASINYSFSDLDSNLFSAGINDEYSTRLDLKLKQPLLRGRGREITETGKRIALLEEKVARMGCRQRLLQKAGEAAQMYWQLYRANEVLEIRRTALDNANKLLVDLQRRVERGRAAKAELIETRATIADREAELARAQQVLTQVLTDIRISLNVREGEAASLCLKPEQAPDFTTREHLGPGKRMTYALTHHPEYLLRDIQRRQAQERYEYAHHMKQPKLDLSLVCSFDSLDPDSSRAFEDSLTSDYRDWHTGVFLEVPLGGNIRARSEALARKTQLEQANHRRDALRNQIASDIKGRWDQLQRAYQEVHKVEVSVGLHEKLLAIERQLFEHGRTRLRDVIEREILLNNARQRFVETAARVEIARIGLMLADGRLLEEYAITFE